MRQAQLLEHEKPAESIDGTLSRLASIADAYAFEVRGEQVARGEPFPVADMAGAIRAYGFRMLWR
jgi:hypothetical protein